MLGLLIGDLSVHEMQILIIYKKERSFDTLRRRGKRMLKLSRVHMQTFLRSRSRKLSLSGVGTLLELMHL
jgi:hypothetical protein